MGYKWGNYFLTWGQVVLDNHHIKTAFCIYADKYAKKNPTPEREKINQERARKKVLA